MKTIVVTGANRGIGHAAARHLAARGHRLILVCRDQPRGAEALSALPHPTGVNGHRLVIADLASLDEVREAARQITELDVPLWALINNAATLSAQRKLSRDGFEMQLAVTHLAHFLLSNLLLPALRRAPAPSRVITVSSGAHAGPPFDFDDPNFERRRYSRGRAYQQSKLANILFTMAFARRSTDTGVQPLALHPGVYETGLLRDYLGAVPGGAAIGKIIGRKADRAGPILAELAVGKLGEDLSGAYFNRATRDSPSQAAQDRDAQERLWDWSAAAVGLDGAAWEPEADAARRLG